MAVNVAVIIFVALFYAMITAAGVWAARITRKRRSKKASETMIVGGRDIGLCLGICTLAATWTGGGALNGTAEAAFDPDQGLLWCIPAVTYGLSITLSGLFIKKLRDKNYVTVLDPFTDVLGKYFSVFYFLVEVFGVVVYLAAILNALGGTLEVIAGLSRVLAIVLSAGIATLYTILGGIYSVAYTDVIQLAFLVLGVVLVIPFAMCNEAVTDIKETFSIENGWSGTWNPNATGQYVDVALVTFLGGVPVQGSYQRLLAIDSTRNAQIVATVGGITSSILVVPAMIIGAIGASTNWTLTEYQNGTGISPSELGEERLILPIVAQYLTPNVVGYFALGAITAAVMSSADSAGLAIAGEFGRNVYQSVIRPKASQREIVWAIRISILLFNAASVAIAIQVNSVMTLYIVCTDLIYVLTWPAFVCVLYFDVNAYGALIGNAIGIIVRVGGGESLLGLAGPFNYAGGTKFPVKTFAMIVTFSSTLIFSYIAKWLFRNDFISARYDFLSSGLNELSPNHPKNGDGNKYNHDIKVPTHAITASLSDFTEHHV